MSVFDLLLQELMAQEEILRKEKELERARERLKQIRNAKYQHGGDDTSGSEPQRDANQHSE